MRLFGGFEDAIEDLTGRCNRQQGLYDAGSVFLPAQHRDI